MLDRALRRGSDTESKFVLSPARANFVRGWLASRCEPDPEYPAAQVSSIYFDTPDWRFLRDKDDSDFLKSKVRLRWYGDAAGRRTTGGPFLEVKRKIGSRRDKRRAGIALDADWLAHSRLDDPVYLGVSDWLSEMGEPAPRPLRPALEIRYRRTRYLHRPSGARLCVDSEIEVPRVNPRALAQPARARACATAVLELKSGDTNLPAGLRPALDFGCRKASFSKYTACCAGLLRSR